MAAFLIIVGGFVVFFLTFATYITPVIICPPILQNPETELGDPIVQLCQYVSR
ncbi:MAG: hypothetical protein ACE5J2_08830 [Nitrososphaerales archaeon]